jgi:alanyl-tRNA synthetase
LQCITQESAVSLQPCQEDAYATRGWSIVTSCTAVDDARYAVLVDRSVLYAEGGGQPADRGTIGGTAVLDVQKDPAGQVCITTDAPVEPGKHLVEVDMVRRFDHMQQHSAQHLITAVACDRFGRNTVSFHLGAETCSIDLDGPLGRRELRALEDAVNEEIRRNHPITSRVVSLEAYATLEVRSRGLPAGYVGDVRLIEIAGLDLNTCGGTHVSQLGELQLIHLLGTEKVRGGARLSFLAGGRALQRLRETTRRIGELNRALKCGPSEHLSAVQRLLDDAKASGRTRKQLLSELGQAIGAGVPGTEPTRAVHIHRPEADLSLLRSVADAARAAGHQGPLLLTGGSGAGVFLLDAEAALVAELGPRVAAALDGRGGGRGTRFQGKAQKLEAADVRLLC